MKLNWGMAKQWSEQSMNKIILDVKKDVKKNDVKRIDAGVALF